MNISDIKAAQPNEIIWDKGSPASIRGLHLRVYPNGSKSFLLYYRNKAGQQRRPKIGDFPALTLADARLIASDWRLKVAKGEDPKQETDNAKAELTVQELFELVHKKYWSQQRFVDSGRMKAAKWAYEHHFKTKLGRLKLSAVTKKTITDWHENQAGTPYSANRSLEFLNTMFVYAEKHELIEYGKNPCRNQDHYREKKRKRYATPEELKLLAEILERDAEKYPKHVVFVWTILFSGSRPKFIENATWADLTEIIIDGKKYGILSLSGKSTADSGEEEVVVLPPQAMKHVDRLPRTSETITGLKLPRKYWYSVRKEAGCIDLRVRDLRRTFATVGLSNGVGIDVISELLNHESVQTTKIYAKLMNQNRIDAARRVADAVESIISKPEKSTSPWPTAQSHERH